MTRVFEVGGDGRYQHQKRALREMIRTGGKTALLMDPGTGKTAVAIDYASLLAVKQEREVRVLVVCPLVAVDTWVLQTQKFASPQVSYWSEALGGSLLQRAEAMAARGGNLYRTRLGTKSPFVWKPGMHPMALHHQRSVAWAARRLDGVEVDPADGPRALGEGPRVVMQIINIDTLSSRAAVGSRGMHDIMVDAIKRFNPDFVVVDESHKIKGATTNASRLLSRVEPFVQRRALLTGTVMPHSPLDVFGQWRFLDPYAFGEPGPDGTHARATMNTFKNKYAVMGGWMGKQVVAYRNLDDMQRVMAQNSVVVRKKDALDLPPTTDVEVPVHLSVAESKAYAEMKDQLSVQISTGVLSSSTNRLTQMLRLRQITSGYLPDDHGNQQVVGRSKALTAQSLINDTLAGEKRVVVFAFFTHEIQMLSQMLAQPDTEIMTVSGGTGDHERVRLRQRFGSSDPQRMIMIAQIKTMSLAVNELVTASHAVFASLSQQRDDFVQARDRLDRIGQVNPVTFWYLIAPGTVDEVILRSHQQRTDLESAMLRHIAEGENFDLNKARRDAALVEALAGARGESR